MEISIFSILGVKMFKNRFKKLIVIAICTILALPVFSFANDYTSVKATTYDLEKTIYVSVSYDIEIEKESIKDVNMSELKVTAKNLANGNSLVIYEDSKKKENADRWCEYLSFSKSPIFKVSIILREVGEYEISIVKTSDESVNFISKFTVTDDASKIGVNYKNGLNENDKNEYVKLINKEIENKKVGSTFSVPSVKDLIDSSLNYDRITKQVYYSEPGAVSYTMVEATKANPSFKISKFGTYRFYTQFYVEQLAFNLEPITLTSDYLLEKKDGFYKLTNPNDNDNQIFVRKLSGAVKYFTDKECENEFTGNVESLTETLIIPIFEFEIKYSNPTVEITSQYEDEGFIGLEYTISSIKVNGTNVETTYILQYAENLEVAQDESAWKTATEEFNLSKLSFIPTKKGVYRVEVYAIDALGNKSEVKHTKNIVVTEKYFEVDYKVSFSDWLSVNTVPFILLCVSATCLLGIIALLVIKPKDKKIDKVEEDR